MDDGDLMTRQQVAYKFETCSSVVAHWARSRLIPLVELRGEDGRPRYRRGDVEALWESGFRYRPRGIRISVARTTTAPGARHPLVPAARPASSPPSDDVPAAGTARHAR